MKKSFLEIAEKNAAMYLALFEFERTMRSFILLEMETFLKPNHGKKWQEFLVNAIDPQMIERIKSREKNSEWKKIYFESYSTEMFEDFLDFSFIKLVCLKWWDKVFNRFFKDQIQFQATIDKIAIIRNSIAHFRNISDVERDVALEAIFVLLGIIHKNLTITGSSDCELLRLKTTHAFLDKFEIYNQIEMVFQSRSLMKKKLQIEDIIKRSDKIEAIGISLNELTIKLDRNLFIETLKNGVHYNLLILDPHGKHTRLREKEEDLPKNQIKNMTDINLKYLKKVKSELPSNLQENLQVSIYDHIPRFNLLFIDSEYLLMQYYASFTRGEDNPCFYIRNRGENGIYDFYHGIFTKIRENAVNIKDYSWKNTFFGV